MFRSVEAVGVEHMHVAPDALKAGGAADYTGLVVGRDFGRVVVFAMQEGVDRLRRVARHIADRRDDFEEVQHMASSGGVALGRAGVSR